MLSNIHIQFIKLKDSTRSAILKRSTIGWSDIYIWISLGCVQYLREPPFENFDSERGYSSPPPPIRNMNVIVQIKLNDIGRKLGIILIATIEVLKIKLYFTCKRTRNWGNILSGILLLFCYYGQCHKEMSPTKTCKYLTIY